MQNGLGCHRVRAPGRVGHLQPTRLFSYQTSYDALGAQCDPSYTLEAGTEGETGFIMSYVTAGDTVVMADYQGEDNAYGVGQLSGYETLDAIRAAERWLGVPEVSTPVGMLGYSGGAVATEFASELAPTYAPHLDIVGVAEGGIPVDLFHDLTYIDNPDSSWTGQIPSYLDGLARGFDIRDLDKLLHAPGHRRRQRRSDPVLRYLHWSHDRAAVQAAVPGHRKNPGLRPHLRQPHHEPKRHPARAAVHR